MFQFDRIHLSPGAVVASVKHLYIYPVKSMRGVSVPAAHLGLNGFDGDRRYAFVRKDLATSDGFPWMTGRQTPRMILYSPRFVSAPIHDDEPSVLVRTPEGAELAVEDPRLRELLEDEYKHDLFLLKNERGNFDSQHISLFSLLTVRQLAMESNRSIDLRQFRANLYLEPTDSMPFTEDSWISHSLQIGDEALIAVTKKDSRCMMINLDPESAVQHPEVLRTVARRHDEQAGVYANVIGPGLIRVGDPIRMAGR